MKIKRSLAWLLLAVLLLSLMAGCGGGGETSSDISYAQDTSDVIIDNSTVTDVTSTVDVDTSSATTTTSKTAVKTTKKDSSPVSSGKVADKLTTLTLVMPDSVNQPLNTDALKFKTITKQTNIELDINIVPPSTYDQKVQSMMASGQVMDIMAVYSHWNQNLLPGRFIDIAPIMEKEMPNYYRWVKDDPMLDWFKIDGKLYYMISVNADSYPLTNTAEEEGVNGNLPVIRYDILEKHNLQVPKSMNEFLTVMKKLKALYPDSTPWSGRSYLRTIYNSLQMFSGYRPNVCYDYYNNRFTIGVLEDGYRRYVQFLHTCYKEGVLDNNFANTNQNTWEQGVLSNKIFFWIDNIGYAQSQTKELQKDNADAYMQVMPLMSNLDDKKFAVAHPENTYGYGFVLSANSANRDVLIKFMDWCYSDEGMYTNNYGEEGVTYTKNKDGSVSIPNDLVKKYENKSSPSFAFNSKYGLCEFGFAPLISRAFDISEAINKKQGVTYWDEAAKITKADKKAGYFHSEKDIVPYIADEDMRTIGNLIETRINSQMHLFITGKRDMSEWNDFVAEIKRYGADEYLKALNNAISR